MTTREEYRARRKAWVDALRSGEYEQGRFLLRNGDCFCCLGVACDISRLGLWVDGKYVTKTAASIELLPDEVEEWLGLAVGEDMIAEVYLSNLNDVDRYTFSELANVVEKNAADLFIPEAV